MDATLHFGKVHIIEWLRPGDRRTGTELFDELEPLGLIAKPQVFAQLHRIVTRAEFLSVLRGIEGEFRETGRLPVLHIETHGDYDGLGISEADGFTFAALMEQLIPLNTMTGLRLIVVMSTCLGMWAIKMLQPSTRAACLAVIGPNREMQAQELARGFQAFYRMMFHAGDGNVAYKAMNDAIDLTKPTFGIANAEMLFRMVYRQFLRERCSPAELAKRAESILHGIRWKYFLDRGRPMPMPAFEYFRTATRQLVENHDEHFDQFRRHYFMYDLFPENARRFPLTLADCLKDDPAERALGTRSADNRLVVGKVHVIEWLDDGDRRTGRETFEEIEPLARAANPPVAVAYHQIDTAGELLGLLRAIEEEYRREPRAPLLHLETHGAQGGIQAQGGAIGWEHLAAALARLNRATGMNLTVMLAACEGFHGTEMLKPRFGPAPFRGLIGPNRVVSDRELLRGMVAFYGTVFRQLDGNRALKAMNNIVDADAETFWLVSAETAFMLAYQNYLETLGSPEGIASRADGIAQRVAARLEAHRGTPVLAEEVEALRQQAQRLAGNNDAHFEIERRKFFYIDEFPENDRRFGFTIEDCRPPVRP